jgi:hypothetical protein
MIYDPMVCSAQTVHLLWQDYNYLQMERNQLPLEPRHLGVPSPKMISKPMARSVKTVQLSYVKINIISKQTEMSFHLSIVT